MFHRLKEQLGSIRRAKEPLVKGGRVAAQAREDAARAAIRAGDVPLQRTEPEPASPEAGGTPPPQAPSLVEAKGYYDMLSNKSSRISQLIVYIEVS